MKSKRGNFVTDKLPWIIISLIVLAIFFLFFLPKIINILQPPP